jgi:hypothetical protein
MISPVARQNGYAICSSIRRTLAQIAQLHYERGFFSGTNEAIQKIQAPASGLNVRIYAHCEIDVGI